MKSIKFSPDFHKKLQILQRRDIKLFDKIQKQLELFKQNPRHKSLRLHKITREVKNTWSISIDKGYRMLYTENGDFYFFKLGTHDEVYKK
ncbi:type II toxin-antitoxin system mRNA interferase toxin, RelE/StbE family [Candidatus Daviesbacteria bacterium]|nr:type II toxin-antitoxin system mRNA interferase toxin, RelE/StbE family [Candidatus Daviesbacteria bacterium]